MNIENELKLIPSKGITREQIAEILRKRGIAVPEEGKIGHQEDTYFDDKQGTLEKTGGSFRIRRKKDKTQVTYKIPIESNTEYKQRREYEIVVPEEHRQDIDMELAIQLLKQEYPELTFPEKMGEILTVINDRNKTNLTCPDGTVLEMAFDTLQGKDANGKIYPVQSEIEFETISGNSENLTDVYEAVLKEFPGQTKRNSLSKYARTKREISSRKLTLNEVSACAILSEILNSTEFSKLQYKGQILHRYDKPTLANLDNFKDFDYLVETLRKIKSGQYKLAIPKTIAEKPEIASLLEGESYEVKDAINLEEMMCLLLSDVKYRVADEVLADFLNTNYYGPEHAMTNRLSHSQQIMLGSGLIAKSSEVGASLEERLTCMISGLSHDIGHFPFAHTIENILNQMDGLCSHELNGKITIDNIYEQAKEKMVMRIKKYFPGADEQSIQDALEGKAVEIEDAVVNHSRKGSEKRSEGINNQAPRETDKICYAASDVCDLIRYAQTVQGRNLDVLDEEWVAQTVRKICGNNEDLASEVREMLDKKYITHLKKGNYGRAVVNAINSIEGIERDGTTYYDVNQKIWKFIEKLIGRVKDVREDMGIEQAKDEMSKAAMSFIIEDLYKEYVQNNGNIDLSWDNLLKTITNMGELDALNHLVRKNQLTLLEQLKGKETITPEEASKIVAGMSDRVYDVSKTKGMTDDEARASAEKIRTDLTQLTPEQVLEYFKKYKFTSSIPIEPIISELHDRADIQLKMNPRYNVSLNGIWRDLKVDARGDAELKTMVDQYYRVKHKGEMTKDVIAKVRHVEGEDFKTLIVKVPIEKNVSERMTKKYKVKGSLNLSVQELMDKLVKDNVGLDIELVSCEPYESIDIRRTEFTRDYGADQVIFTQDTFNGRNGAIMQEIEIKCPSFPKAVAKIKAKLKAKYKQYFITDSKIDRVQESKNKGFIQGE